MTTETSVAMSDEEAALLYKRVEDLTLDVAALKGIRDAYGLKLTQQKERIWKLRKALVTCCYCNDGWYRSTALCVGCKTLVADDEENKNE